MCGWIRQVIIFLKILQKIGILENPIINKQTFIKKRRDNFDFLYRKLEQFKDYFILPEKEKFSQPISNDFLRNSTDKQFLKLHKKFFKLRFKAWLKCVLIEAFDPWGNTIINERLKISINPEKLAVLTGPKKLTKTN